MKITIKNHDATKRYLIRIRCGGVIKKIKVPAGMQMPMLWKNEPTPLREGNATGVIGIEGQEPVPFSFLIDDAANYAYADANIMITS